jgi:hypothetical protein
LPATEIQKKTKKAGKRVELRRIWFIKINYLK